MRVDRPFELLVETLYPILSCFLGAEQYVYRSEQLKHISRDTAASCYQAGAYLLPYILPCAQGVLRIKLN